MKKVILLSLTATIMALGFASCNLCSHANLYSKVIKPVTCQEDGKIQFYCADCGKKASTQVLDHESFAEHKFVWKTDVDAQTIFVYTLCESGKCELCGEDNALTVHVFNYGDVLHCFSCGLTKEEIKAHAE